MISYIILLPPAAKGALFEKTAPLDPPQKLLIGSFVQEKGVWHKFTYCGFFPLTVLIAQIDNGVVSGEFSHHLAASTAGRKKFLCITYYQDFSNAAFSITDHPENSITFSTNGQTVRRIFHITPGINFPGVCY
jgi:hypothetical protein